MNYKNRKLPRLKEFDYSQNGCYFITICTKDMKSLLSLIEEDSDVDNVRLILSEYGKTVKTEILKMNECYKNVQALEYVIMPNHVHMIVEISNGNEDGTLRAAFPTKSLLSEYVRTLKRFCNKRIGNNIWQKSFHDHIIRNDEDYILHVQYINENPKKWLIGKDKYYA